MTSLIKNQTAKAGEAIASGATTELVERSWPASLELMFEFRAGKTALTRARHFGPLRVQRPFYPEGECAHIYLLHPPGGLVVGDALTITLDAEPKSATLVTTPSAGKIYSLQGLQHCDARTEQCQNITVSLAANARLEWLPQETIVFNGANARLTTRVNATSDSQFVVWDIVCLGRPACDELFTQGSVYQDLEVTIDGNLELLERNRILGGDAYMARPWGLAGAGSFGTMVMNVTPSRVEVDEILELLEKDTVTAGGQWGLTQKGSLFIARYLGASAWQARHGFTKIWTALRPLSGAGPAVLPRIWNT